MGLGQIILLTSLSQVFWYLYFSFYAELATGIIHASYWIIKNMINSHLSCFHGVKSKLLKSQNDHLNHEQKYIKRKPSGASLMVKNPPANERDTGLIPDQERRDPTCCKLSLCTTTMEAVPYSLCSTTRKASSVRSRALHLKQAHPGTKTKYNQK